MKKLILYLAILILTASCHTASYHFDKFIDKGGKVETRIDSIQVLTKINGKDSLVYVKVECPGVEIPKSNTEIRQEGKTSRRAIKANERVDIQKLKNENSALKEENKTLRTLGKYKTKENIRTNKQDNKTKRVEERQQGKTERKKYNIWWIILYILGVITIPIIKVIRKFFL